MTQMAPLYQVQQQDGVHVIEFLKDNLDPLAVEEIKVDIPRLIEQSSVRKLVLDLSKVHYVPSRMLGVLMETHQFMNAHKGRLLICGLQPMILNVFQFMRLDTVLSVVKTREEAIKKLNAG